MKTITFAGYNINNEGGNLIINREIIKYNNSDYGADPLGDGTFRMVPSGDIVSFDERNKRLQKRK